MFKTASRLIETGLFNMRKASVSCVYFCHVIKKCQLKWQKAVKKN